MNKLRTDLPVKDDFIRVTAEALDFIERHLTEPISVKEVTEKFENSHWHFQRMFRSFVGVSMGQYLRQRRLSESAKRLRTTKERVLDIAIDFDFGSQEAFARAFKQYFNMAPTDYRDNREFVLLEVRNPITPDKLEYFWNNVQRAPDIVEFAGKNIVGSKVDFVSHFIEGTDCVEKILPHWLNFLKVKKRIVNQVDGDKLYGVALTDELELREQRLSYVAGVEVTKAAESIGDMVSVQLPAGLYASFANKGLAAKSSVLMDYVYGIWLPASGYKRGRGYDFEVFDHRYNQQNENSISHLMIPIEQES